MGPVALCASSSSTKSGSLGSAGWMPGRRWPDSATSLGHRRPKRRSSSRRVSGDVPASPSRDRATSGGVGEDRRAPLEVGHDRLDLVRAADQAADHPALLGELRGRVRRASSRLNRAFAPRTASGLRPAISRASASASSRGSSDSRVARPSSQRLDARDDPAGEGQLLGDVGADELAEHERARSCPGPGPSGPPARTAGRRGGRCGCRRRARSGCRRRARGRARRR